MRNSINSIVAFFASTKTVNIYHAFSCSQWHVNPDRFVGRIMRINVTCENSKNTRQKKYKTGVMVFKVNGTFRGKPARKTIFVLNVHNLFLSHIYLCSCSDQMEGLEFLTERFLIITV